MAGERIALVTGASRGIGEATALEFATRGYDLGITSIEGEVLEKVAGRIREKGVRVFTAAGDLADLAFAESFVKDAARALGAAAGAGEQRGLAGADHDAGDHAGVVGADAARVA